MRLTVVRCRKPRSVRWTSDKYSNRIHDSQGMRVKKFLGRPAAPHLLRGAAGTRLYGLLLPGPTNWGGAVSETPRLTGELATSEIRIRE